MVPAGKVEVEGGWLGGSIFFQVQHEAFFPHRIERFLDILGLVLDVVVGKLNKRVGGSYSR